MTRLILLILTLMLVPFGTGLADFLYTVDGKVYEGKMVDFKYSTVYFNVYRFGSFYRSQRFPLHNIWKIEFNPPQAEGNQLLFETTQDYNKFRRGKKSKRITLPAKTNWLDTGIDLRVGQEILFEVQGSILISPEIRVFADGEIEPRLNQGKQMPSQPSGALIARIGNGPPFYVGDDKAPFPIGERGRLHIGINDFNFADNSGEFTVTIYY